MVLDSTRNGEADIRAGPLNGLSETFATGVAIPCNGGLLGAARDG